MWHSALIVALVTAGSSAAADEPLHICWVRGASLSPAGEAVVTFDQSARGHIVIIGPGGSRPDASFSLVPENTGQNGGKSTVAIPKDKEARVSQGHEGCAIRWAEEGSQRGIRITATSSYFPPGGAPTTAQAFVPFRNK